MFRKYEPQSELMRQYIQLFSLTRFDEGTDFSGRKAKAVPYGAVNLIFCFGFQFRYFNDRQDFRVGSHLKGPSLNYYQLEHCGKIDLWVVNFKPYGFYPFIKFPVYTFYGKILDMKEVDPALVAIDQQLQLSPDDDERLAILEEKIMQLFNPKRTEMEDIIASIDIIEQKQGLLSLEELLALHPMNPRTLERRFRNIVGMTPKNYIRLVRFQNVLKKVRSDRSNRNWIEVALESGYYDQPHFIRDFKEFMGNSPEVYLSKRDLLLDIFQPF
ncbi:MAG TPA: helix-turn-helix domain-containing protein [Bacillota bacterium]|nr:helix-turn-helix domain-containing protein [Bacillota bacterium]